VGDGVLAVELALFGQVEAAGRGGADFAGPVGGEGEEGGVGGLNRSAAGRSQ